MMINIQKSIFTSSEPHALIKIVHEVPMLYYTAVLYSIG